MDFVITFFRDVLDGPLYIVVAIICGILICSCIGYLGEQYLNKEKAKKEFEATHAELSSPVANDVVNTSVVTNGPVENVSTSIQEVNNVTNNSGQ